MVRSLTVLASCSERDSKQWEIEKVGKLEEVLDDWGVARLKAMRCLVWSRYC
ncbi:MULTISPECIES: hypothetical protein [unclassified Paenibacillus]|uniref:hypothetical protein n=1 Tax=unclassified Paenibacillus TaxID=185978 RepID=UPI00142D2953|nr:MULTISPECIES: hypothetical protein [unclassified Paenibacillus]